jgi:hypothetical protein
MAKASGLPGGEAGSGEFDWVRAKGGGERELLQVEARKTKNGLLRAVMRGSRCHSRLRQA